MCGAGRRVPLCVAPTVEDKVARGYGNSRELFEHPFSDALVADPLCECCSSVRTDIAEGTDLKSRKSHGAFVGNICHKGGAHSDPTHSLRHVTVFLEAP